MKTNFQNITPSLSPASGRLTLLSVIPEYEETLERFLGRRVRPSSPKTIVEFSLLPIQHQSQAIAGLQSQLSFMREAISNGLDAYSETGLIRMAMTKLNLLAEENFMDKILSDDIVEIFDLNHIQVYRSYSCFALCNYSVAELVTYPWYELYDRPTFVTEKLLNLCMPVFKGEHNSQHLEDAIAPYVLKETRTEEKSAFLVKEKFYARMLSTITHEPYVLSVKEISALGAGTRGITFI